MTPRVALLLIAALFIVPLAVAWLMYAGVIEFQPGTTRNLGQLVEPPRPLSWEGIRVPGEDDYRPGDFAGHWLVLHGLPDACGEDCIEVVVSLRQVHRAAGRNSSRIRLGLLQASTAGGQDRLRDIYPEFHLLEDSGRQLWPVLRSVASAAPVPGGAEGATYLVDPLGNIMMYYAPGSDPNDLKHDLKRLLTWSKLDES
jgi:hypothetical protein